MTIMSMYFTEIIMKRHKRTVIILHAYGAHLHGLILVYIQDMAHHHSFWGNVDRKKVHRVQSGAWIWLLPHLTPISVSLCRMQTRTAHATFRPM